jgi:hypothetical protein
MNRSIVTTAGTVLLLTVVGHSQGPRAGSLRAGAHKVDFTPKASELQLSTDSIRDHLFARAIVVDDGSTCAALVGIDLGAAPNQIVDDAIASMTNTESAVKQRWEV